MSRHAFNAAVAVVVIVGLVATAASPLHAQSPPDRDSTRVYVLEPLTVEGRSDDLVGLVGSSSVGYVGYRDLRLRPLSRSGELLEAVPGMILTQHSGSGKSNQIFVRGFNLDHGTDFATWVDGMPVNIASHAHGQGYTDFNFVIPELVDHVEYTLGNHHAEVGDFGSAGSAHVRLRQSLSGPLASLSIGANGHRRFVGAASAALGDATTLLAGGELHGYDGPWERPEELAKRNATVRLTRQGVTTRWTVVALAYDNAWQASDQIPLRAVAAGTVGRFGQIDPTLGGSTSRASLSSTWTRSVGGKSQQVDLYAIRYALDLFSNFTYLLDDPAAGDQIRQHDEGRWTVGANAAHRMPVAALGRDHEVTVGLQLRWDDASLALARSLQRSPIETVRRDELSQGSAGVHAELLTRWSSTVRTTLGVRGDLHHFRVSSDRAANSGRTRDEIVSPKASIAFGPWSGTEFYLSGGLGFHSNDGRGVLSTVDPWTGAALQPADPLVRSRGAEVGVRLAPIDRLRSTATLWTMALDSELLFVGDAGTTEASDPSRRVGLTVTNFLRFAASWSADLDVSVTRARLDVDGAANRIPGAMESVVAAGIARDPASDGVIGAVRLRRFGSYPLSEDGMLMADPGALVNLDLGYRVGSMTVRVALLNAFDADHADIQYLYTSRLSGEPTEGVEDVHFHPVEPRQLRMTVSWGR